MKKYPKSIITDDMEHCYICGSSNVEIHHCMNGYGIRDKATKYGLVVPLCREHHTQGFYSAHNNEDLKLFFKKLAQERFEKLHGKDKFMEEFHKNYL